VVGVREASHDSAVSSVVPSVHGVLGAVADIGKELSQDALQNLCQIYKLSATEVSLFGLESAIVSRIATRDI
jgi:hypothetical protein